MSNKESAETEKAGLLSPFRVLDLTDEKGAFCGKLLGDLGADVIKIEKPGGDPARSYGPFFHDETEPEKSLSWFAFNNNKRGITLNLKSVNGRVLFNDLFMKSDVVVESFPPGYMDDIRLGYSHLEQVNPRIILVSITPFGQTGPYRDYKANDLVLWAMGGYMYPFGDTDRPPIRISHHSQAYLHAASEAACGAVTALYMREITGKGQHVDVSIQEAVAKLDMTQKWDMLGISLKRGEWLPAKTYKTRYIWPCKDGHVMWNYWIGPVAKLWGTAFSQWVIDEGFADEFYKQLKWETLDASTVEGERQIEEAASRTEPVTVNFFTAHTKAELAGGARKRGLMLYPVADIQDVTSSEHLKARGFWTELPHPELGISVRYPGPFAHSTEAPPRLLRRAPLIGEHNHEIYQGELGLSEKEITQLKRRRVI